ncbi:unnamed protein product [Mytilus coruscus]|uniref:Uncharacterized protein n=1 Tax=Mytilus coruscus TaxID=42192 RepID=A0A6J8ANZ1_MYTCO|nr:unnamed protein product [Mytilus coruscus]
MSSSYPPAYIPMEKSLKRREFSGYPQENATEFLVEFESYSTLYDLQDPKHTIAAFHLHLKGQAPTMFNDSVKGQTHKKLTIPPNSECIVWEPVPTYILPGLNGVFSNHKFILEKGLMVAKSLVTVSHNHKVPVKVLTALSVVIPKERAIAEFLSLNSDYSCVSIDQSCPVVQNIDIVNGCVTPDLKDCSDICSTEHIEKVKNQFTLYDHLLESHQTELTSLLLNVIDDSPNLGYTKLIEHTIHLKPDATGKHQKPYRLPPYKREILRHHQIQNKLEVVLAIHVSTEEQQSEHSDPYDAETDVPQDGNKQFKLIIKPQRIFHKSSKLDTNIDSDKIVNDKILAKISMPINNIKEFQRQDPLMYPIIDYLENDILPDLQKEAICVLLKSNDYALIHYILFHSRVAKSKQQNDVMLSNCCTSDDSPLGGHAGITIHLTGPSNISFFPRMGKNIQTCHFCQVRKVTNFQTKQAIVSFPLRLNHSKCG